MKRVEVAIGIVVRDGRILICRRLEQATLGGYWEFPGGKLEAGESPEQCLARELAEELAIEADPIRGLPPIEFDYSSAQVRLHPFLCRHRAGEPRPLASQEVRWALPADLRSYRFPPANDPLIRDLAARPSLILPADTSTLDRPGD